MKPLWFWEENYPGLWEDEGAFYYPSGRSYIQVLWQKEAQYKELYQDWIGQSYDEWLEDEI